MTSRRSTGSFTDSRCRLKPSWRQRSTRSTTWSNTGRRFGGKLSDVDSAVDKGMSWLAERVGPYGGPLGKFPWDVIECASTIKSPRSREIVMKLLPALLRTQDPDGGWGGSSPFVLAVLKKFGIIGRLSKLPSLPPDCQITRSIPAPAGANSLACHRGMLWTAVPDARQIAALSPEDGQMQKTLRFENLGAVATWDGTLAVAEAEPSYALHEIDVDTGEAVRSVEGHAAYSGGLRTYATRDSARQTCEGSKRNTA